RARSLAPRIVLYQLRGYLVPCAGAPDRPPTRGRHAAHHARLPTPRPAHREGRPHARTWLRLPTGCVTRTGASGPPTRASSFAPRTSPETPRPQPRAPHPRRTH